MLTLKSTDLVWRTRMRNFYSLSAFLEKSSVLAILSSLVFLTCTCKDIPHYNHVEAWTFWTFGDLHDCHWSY